MPYSGPSDEKLPSNVKKMEEKDRRQWVSIFNSAMAEHNDEAKAMMMANGVLKKKKETYVGYEAYKRQVSPGEAEYDPLGADDTSGCANCHWYVSPDACLLVMGDISPTGKSKFWMKKTEPEVIPLPVTIVDSDKELTTIFGRIKELFLGKKNEIVASGDSDIVSNDKAPVQAPVQTQWLFIKQLDGRTRFFTTFSNNFKDKEKEIIAEEAHKEYVDWAERTKSYPELWLWHSGKDSKWGQTDWLDYTSGFVCASGLIDENKEYIAERLAQKDIGVSHGFLGLILPNEKIVRRYRTFEISPLPAEHAANAWTNFSTDLGELKMPFTDARKTFLKEISGLTDEQIATWETNADNMSKALKDVGIDFKDTGEADTATQISTLTEAVKTLAEQVKNISDAQSAYTKSLAEEIEKVYTAEVFKSPGGFKASESKETEVPEEKRKDLEKKNDWFGELIGSI